MSHTGGLAEASIDFYGTALHAAEQAIDQVCAQGGDVLYGQYLQPKVRPYETRNRALSMAEACQLLAVPGDAGVAGRGVDADGQAEAFACPREDGQPQQIKYRLRGALEHLLGGQDSVYDATSMGSAKYGSVHGSVATQG